MTLPPRDNCTCDDCCQPDPRMTPTNDAPVTDDDGPCTTCDDTGITIQTERPCSCDAGDQYRPKSDAPVMAEQCDREAAARERTAEYEGYGFKAESLETPTEMRRGHRDWDPLVQKHARHRLAGLASAPAGDGVKPWEGANAVEQGVYDHFMSGSQRGYLYDSVRRGRLNVAKPARADGTQFAAWMAGRHLAEREALARPHPAVAPAGDEALAFALTVKAELVERAPTYGISSIEREHFDRAILAIAALARPRAAVGEQSREALEDAIGAAYAAWVNDESDAGMSETIADAILALQSPPAKVEG